MPIGSFLDARRPHGTGNRPPDGLRVVGIPGDPRAGFDLEPGETVMLQLRAEGQVNLFWHHRVLILQKGIENILRNVRLVCKNRIRADQIRADVPGSAPHIISLRSSAFQAVW